MALINYENLFGPTINNYEQPFNNFIWQTPDSSNAN